MSISVHYKDAREALLAAGDLLCNAKRNLVEGTNGIEAIDEALNLIHSFLLGKEGGIK